MDARLKRIDLAEDGSVAGLELVSGERVEADLYISAMPGGWGPDCPDWLVCAWLACLVGLFLGGGAGAGRWGEGGGGPVHLGHAGWVDCPDCPDRHRSCWLGRLGWAHSSVSLVGRLLLCLGLPGWTERVGGGPTSQPTNPAN